MKHTVRIVLALALVLVFSCAAWAFTDTAALNEQQTAAVEYLSGLGVIEGYPDNTFRPYDTVTRAEFAKMICMYAGYGELNSSSSPFGDVASGVWYFGWVNRAAQQELVVGDNEGNYLPNSTITQQEIATILLRLDGLEETGLTWPADYIKAAQERGLNEGFSFAGTTAASRIVAAQMIYNLANPAVDEESSTGSTLAGIVTGYSGGSITIQTIDGKSASYNVETGKLPSGLVVGCYVEVTLQNGAVSEFTNSIIPKKGTAYWDLNQDGSKVTIDGKEYDISSADIYVVQYNINSGYTADSFVSAGAIDRGALSLGGTLASDMAVVIKGSDTRIQTAYLVNASVVYSNGHLGMTDGKYTNGDDTYLDFVGTAGLRFNTSLSEPPTGVLIYYTLKDGKINDWVEIFDPSNPSGARALAEYLTDTDPEAPYAWVMATSGKPNANNTVSGVVCNIIDYSTAGRGVRLGADDHNSQVYWLRDDCLIYEVDADGEVTKGNNRSLVGATKAAAIVNRSDEICYIMVYID